MGPMNSVVTEKRKWASSTSETQARPRSHEQSSRTKPQIRPRSAPVKLEPLKRSRPKPDSEQQTYTPEEQTVTFKRGDWDKIETQIHEENDKVYTSSKSASATETKDVVQYVNEICKLHDDIDDLNDQIETLKNRKKAGVDIVDPDDLQGDELRFPE